MAATSTLRQPAGHRRGRPWPIVLAAVLGLVAGAGAVAGPWYWSTRPSIEGTAQADARTACLALGRVGPVTADVRNPQAHRIRAAAELSSAAAELDARYGSLAEQAQIVDAGLATFNLEAVNSGLRRARELCTGLT